MGKMLNHFVLLLPFALLTSAQIPFFGPCPQIAAQKDFNLDQFSGVWHEVERFFSIYEVWGKCGNVEFAKQPDGKIKVTNRDVNRIYEDTPRVLVNEAVVENATEPAKWLLFPADNSSAIPYWVVDTDYKTYAITWSCEDVVIYRAEFLWILTREQNPPEDVIKTARTAAEKAGLKTNSLKRTIQKDCTSKSTSV